MSIANALNNAISGLTATSRGAEVVSSNLANAMTPGYAPRELELSPRALGGNGGGVHVDGVSRIISNTVLADFRLSNAAARKSSVAVDFYRKIEAAIGQPQDSGSLSAMMTEVKAALISASSRPDNEVRLQAVFETATQLARKINSVSAAIQESRTSADRMIDRQIDALNNDLNEVARLNRQIIVEQANGRDSASLEDARRVVVDRISSVVPVREVSRENGRIALFTQSGATLLDGKTPVQFAFEPTGQLTPAIDESSALLGHLSIDGVTTSPSDMKLFSGGSLSELFKLRDDYAISAQAGIDRIARELHDRFADPAIDPTIVAGASGLFSDSAGAFNPTQERGLALRLIVNSSVDEAQGGQLWRIRDGIYATTPGAVGDGTRLTGLSTAMAAAQPYSSDPATGIGSVSTLTATYLSDISSSRIFTENQQAHDLTMQVSLEDALLADGVDSDREMEMLLQLEKANAANAKVIQVVNEMLDQILRI